MVRALIVWDGFDRSLAFRIEDVFTNQVLYGHQWASCTFKESFNEKQQMLT